MNNTFSFNRFKNLLHKDGIMYFRNFSTSLIVFCCLNAIIWIFNLLFGTTSEPIFRFGMICLWTCLAIMFVPSKVYGNANLPHEGVGFAMLPASSLEKFISMFLYCAIVTPIIVFFGSYLVDALLALFPIGGFGKPIHLYTINDIVRMMNDSEGVVKTDDMVIFNNVFSIGVIRAQIYVRIIFWAAIFMLGNMLFKKHKLGKTIAAYLGIFYLISIIIGSVFISTGVWMGWTMRMSNLSVDELIRVLNFVMACSMTLEITTTILLLFFTYRKIKTQKY